MVNKAAKKTPKTLPTWWDRGPAGMVEEWETRVSQEEITRRQKRWQSISGKTPKDRVEESQSHN